MVLFFQRTLDTVRDRYRQILRVETTKFDPLVSRYFEREYTVNGTTSGTATKTGSVTGVNAKTIYDHDVYHDHTDNDLSITNDHDQNEGWITDDNHTETEGHEGTEGNNTVTGSNRSQSENHNHHTYHDFTDTNDTVDGTNSNINHEALKQAPMNASGVQTIGSGDDRGKLTNLNFDYASMYKQDDNSGKNHAHTDNDVTSDGWTQDDGNSGTAGSHTDTHIIHEGTDKSGYVDEDNRRDYHDVTDHTYDDERDITADGWKTKNGTVRDERTGLTSDQSVNSGSNYEISHDRYTGRDGVLPQDALKSAMNYLQNYSTAFEWLCNKLEINFIGIYDI